MIFESLWPLFFLLAVPIIIILYLLKPKGEDYEISSNLLWKKLIKNQQSKTFFEKFVHNILMYLQILIIALLVLALMSPFIQKEGKTGGRKILLMDTSGSMLHKDSNGKTRLEEAVEQACDYVRTMDNTRFSIVTIDGGNARLLAVDSSDRTNIIRILQSLECSHSGGSLAEAQSIIDSLLGENSEEMADLLVYTDGSGAEAFQQLHGSAGMNLYVNGDAVNNLANEYLVFSERQDGLYDVLVSVTNYSNGEASCDVGLYDEEEQLLHVKSLSLLSGENRICLFEGMDWQGERLSARISGISFANGEKDSLSADDISYAVKNKGDLIHGILIGEGNTFLEKAYLAVTGTDIAKGTTVATEDTYNVIVYDAGHSLGELKGNRLLFGDAYGSATEELNHVVLDMADCDLSAGLNDFYIGVNKAYCFELPEGAHSFLEYEGKTVGYYRDTEEYREIVVGFDIRESDFPLRAEFPVFLANAMIYLSDTSWLATNVYYAGEELALQPWAEVAEVPALPKQAGCYEIGNEEYRESYVVRFNTGSESDGRAVAESVTGEGNYELRKVKQTLRNLFLILVLIILVTEWVIYVRQMRYKGKFYLIVRSMVTICVLLALLGVKLPTGGNRTATIFLVDLSNSNKAHLEEAEAYLRDTISQMPSGNSYGIVTFGSNTLVEQFVTGEKQYTGLMTIPEKSATNFEEAISKAISMIPENSKGRLVLLTDGKETKGDIHRMAQAVTASRVEMCALLYESEQLQDAYIDNVTLPAYLHPGDEYSIKVLVESNYDTDAVITIFNGSKQVAANQVHLNKGSNHFVFREQVSGELEGNAMESLRIQVNAAEDGCEENNSYNAFAVVEAPPKVLVITDRNTDITAFSKVLEAAGSDYTVLSALNAPDNIQDMLTYKSIILVDTYIDELPSGFLTNLESYVKDYGCGFVCCGGEDSFALGGYRDTVIETILPVDMELRGMNEAPTMAMVMVIDHSGSMMGDMSGQGGSNLDVAIKATNVAVDNLRDKDYVGVLTFDDGYDWQVQLTKAEERESIKTEVKKIEAGGGTTIKPALQEAFRAISESDASVKHVILLTDGMGETTNYTDVIKNYNEGGITLSTVAVGRDSDTKLLENLAEECGGRYYYSDLSSDIPKIFAREVFLGGDSFIQNGDFALSVRSGHELTKELFAEGWPYVYGYVAASPKTASSSIITSAGKEDPILTVWQYGLGRTVAWNTDVTGEWSGGFSGKEDYAQLWKRIVDYSAGNAHMGEDNVNVVTLSEHMEITYEAKDYGTDTEIMATVINPEGQSSEVKLYATAPGKYKAELPTDQNGMYHFNIRRLEKGEIAGYMTTAAAVQFSDEYKYDVDTSAFISFMEKQGELINESDYLWTRITKHTGGKKPLANILIATAIVLFLLDVAMRRFQYVPKWKVKKAKTDTPAQEKEQTTVSDVENVAEVKREEPVKKTRENAKTSKKNSSSQTLDTSALLKKKDDRNI